MGVQLKSGEAIIIREFNDSDFQSIQELNKLEGWTTLFERGEDTKEAWRNSNIAFVAIKEDQIIGYIRGLTDTLITLYICELLIKEEFRAYGIGKTLLKYVHSIYPKTRMEMLASSSSHTYYEALKFRPFYGYRKTIEE